MDESLLEGMPRAGGYHEGFQTYEGREWHVVENNATGATRGRRTFQETLYILTMGVGRHYEASKASWGIMRLFEVLLRP